MDLLQTFVTARVADGRAPRTIHDYHRVLDPFIIWIGERGKPFPDLTRDDIRDYAAHLRNKGWKDGTVAIHLRNLRAFLRWLSDEGYTASNLANAIKAPHKVTRIEIPITWEEVCLMLDTCQGDEFHSVRDRALMLTLYDAGPRCGELVRLKVGNWRREPGSHGSYLLIYAPKTRSNRFAILGQTTTKTMDAFMALRQNARDDDPLFCHEDDKPIKEKCVEAMLLRRAKKAGLERGRVHPHIWRKAFATAFADNGGDTERLRVLMGWSSAEMAGIYVNSSLRRLQEIHRHVGPVDHQKFWRDEADVV